MGIICCFYFSFSVLLLCAGGDSECVGTSTLTYPLGWFSVVIYLISESLVILE